MHWVLRCGSSFYWHCPTGEAKVACSRLLDLLGKNRSAFELLLPSFSAAY